MKEPFEDAQLLHPLKNSGTLAVHRFMNIRPSKKENPARMFVRSTTSQIVLWTADVSGSLRLPANAAEALRGN